MTISLDERFRRACLAADPADHAAIFAVLLTLEQALRDPHKHRGLGLRKVHPAGVWEVRIGLSRRALFVLRANEAVFLVLGTHEEVKRFLRGL